MGIRTWLSPRRRQRDLLHAYVDGELTGVRLARFEAELARDGALAREAAQLSAIRRAAARLPGVEAPRSFRLTPAMVAAPAKAETVAARSPAMLRLAQGVAAFSVLALAMTFVAQSLGGGSGSDDRAASAETGNLAAAQDASAKSAGAAGGAAPAAATGDPSRSQATVAPTLAPFNPTLPPYSPTSSVTGQGVTATAGGGATSPTPRAPATGPGDAATPFASTPIATPVAPVTGGEGVTPRATAGAAYSADGGVTGGAVPPASADDSDDSDGGLRLLQAALGVAALGSIGVAAALMLRRRRMT